MRGRNGLDVRDHLRVVVIRLVTGWKVVGGGRPWPRRNGLRNDAVTGRREGERLPVRPEQLDVVGPSALADVVAGLHERRPLVLVRDAVDDERPDRRRLVERDLRVSRRSWMRRGDRRNREQRERSYSCDE